MLDKIPPRKIQRARELRRAQTIYEKNLWDILRAHRLEGFHFRRQHPIGPYVADFACIAAKLILELDGNSHDARIERDVKRDEFLGRLGWKTLRFPNVYARDNPDGLWHEIELELRVRLSPSGTRNHQENRALKMRCMEKVRGRPRRDWGSTALTISHCEAARSVR